jgi:hypothetical protein
MSKRTDTFDPNDPFADDFSFEAVENPDESVKSVVGQMESLRDAAIRKHSESMKEVERLILPLLKNLLKNPDKGYIKWENRTEAINSQIAKITAVTRKPLDIA